MKKIVVIGGGAAGMTFAAQIVKFSKDYEVIVLEKTNKVAWAGCPTPYYIGDMTANDHMLGSDGSAFSSKGINVKINSEVTNIDFDNKKLNINSNDFINYDILVIALGAKAIALDIEGLNDNLKNSFVLTHAIHAINIKEYLKNLKKNDKVSIIGAGFVGLEMAEALNHLGYDVTVIEKSDKLFPRLNQEILKPMYEEIKKDGVKLLFNSEVTSVITDNDLIKKVVINDNKELDTDFLLTAVGVKPNIELFKTTKLELENNFIKVNDKFETNIKDVYAMGDLIRIKHQQTNELVYLPLGDVADKQGIYLAKNLAGKNMSYKGANGAFATSYKDIKLSSVGLTEEVAKKKGINASSTIVTGVTKTSAFKDQKGGTMEIVYNEDTYEILGATMVGDEAVAQFVDQISLAIYNKMTFDDVLNVDYCYSPTNSSVWNPLLAGYRRVMKGKK